MAMTDSKETTGKALEFDGATERKVLCAFSADKQRYFSTGRATIDDVAAALLANPEARMAVLAALGHVEEVEARVVDGLKKRATEAEARLAQLQLVTGDIEHIRDHAKNALGLLSAPTADRGNVAGSLDYCCHKCHGRRPLDRMILCPTCGNKRCPRASDHELACSGSNEPGQPGSVYVAAPTAENGKDSAAQGSAAGTDSAASSEVEAPKVCRVDPCCTGLGRTYCDCACHREPAPVAEAPRVSRIESPACKVFTCDELQNGTGYCARHAVGGQVAVAEAPERVTHSDAREVVHSIPLVAGRQAQWLERFIAQREAADREHQAERERLEGEVAGSRERCADLANEVGPLRLRAERAHEAILDIDSHATPCGLLDEADPGGSPAYYTVTTGSLHRALGVVGHSAPKAFSDDALLPLKRDLDVASGTIVTLTEELNKAENDLDCLANATPSDWTSQTKDGARAMVKMRDLRSTATIAEDERDSLRTEVAGLREQLALVERGFADLNDGCVELEAKLADHIQANEALMAANKSLAAREGGGK